MTPKKIWGYWVFTMVAGTLLTLATGMPHAVVMFWLFGTLLYATLLGLFVMLVALCVMLSASQRRRPPPSRLERVPSIFQAQQFCSTKEVLD
jgi:hypothetical protein